MRSELLHQWLGVGVLILLPVLVQKSPPYVGHGWILQALRISVGWLATRKHLLEFQSS